MADKLTPVCVLRAHSWINRYNISIQLHVDLVDKSRQINAICHINCIFILALCHTS